MSARGGGVKQFEWFNGLDTVLYQNVSLTLYNEKLAVSILIEVYYNVFLAVSYYIAHHLILSLNINRRLIVVDFNSKCVPDEWLKTKYIHARVLMMTF